MPIAFKKMTDPAVYKSMIEGANTIDDIVGTFNRLFDGAVDVLMLNSIRDFKKYYRELKETSDFMRKFDLMKRIGALEGSLEEILSMSGLNLMEVQFDLDQVPGIQEIGKEAKAHFEKTGAGIQWDMDFGAFKEKIAELETEKEEISKIGSNKADKIQEARATELEGLFKGMRNLNKQFFTLKDDYYDVSYRPYGIKVDPELLKRYEEYTRKYDALKKEQDEYRSKHKTILEEIHLKTQSISNELEGSLKEINAQIDEIHSEVGERILEVILQKSPISGTQAQEWSESQSIPKNAQRRMAKAGYKIADVRKDMAEFYRLTGGRLPKCEVVTEGRRRACAWTAENKVSIDSHFNKTTFFHEMGHLLENDQKLERMSQAFLISRVKPGSNPIRLSRLDPGKRYRNDEVAFQDDFFSPYVGKYYGHGITEVISMGVQMFANPRLMVDLHDRDREMFNMIYGMLLTPPGENELSETLEEADVVLKEKARDGAFFQALNKKIKNESLFEKFRDLVTVEPHTRYGRKRPSVWTVYVGEDRYMFWFKSKRAAFQFAYLCILYPEKRDIHERNIKGQKAPDWYKTGDPIPEV